MNVCLSPLIFPQCSDGGAWVSPGRQGQGSGPLIRGTGEESGPAITEKMNIWVFSKCSGKTRISQSLASRSNQPRWMFVLFVHGNGGTKLRDEKLMDKSFEVVNIFKWVNWGNIEHWLRLNDMKSREARALQRQQIHKVHQQILHGACDYMQ